MIRLLLTMLTVFAVVTQAARAQPLPPDIADIKKSGQLIVGMTQADYPPWYSGPPDKLKGLDVDIGRAVAAYIGVKPVFRRDGANFNAVVEQLRAGEIDVMISKLSITPPRMSLIRFSVPYVTLHQAMLINRLWLSQNAHGRTPDQVIREFDGTLAVMKNTSYEVFAKTSFRAAKYLPSEKWDDVVAGVMSGKTAAAFRDEFEIKRLSFERPEASISTKTAVLTDTIDNLAAAVNYKSTTLLAIVDRVIATQFANIDVKRLIAIYRDQLAAEAGGTGKSK